MKQSAEVENIFLFYFQRGKGQEKFKVFMC